MGRRFGKGVLSAWLGAVAFVAGHAHVLAQATDAASDRAQSFQAVTGGVQEDIAGGPLMLLAYAIVWVAVFGYVFRLSRLQRGVEGNLERLERTLAAAPHAQE
jgi:CcmD family protein